MTKLICIILLIVILGLSIYGTTFLVIQNYKLEKSLDANINRAQWAGNAKDMKDYIEKVKLIMEEKGLTTGYFALVFKKPDNDWSLHYRTINRIIERLDAISSEPESSTTYQVALDDIRGVIRELPNPSSAQIWCWYWYDYLLVIIGWLLVVAIGMFMGLGFSDY